MEQELNFGSSKHLQADRSEVAKESEGIANTFNSLRQRLERISQIEGQERQAIELLLSDEWIEGETEIHRAQLEFIDKLIEITDDTKLKSSLIETKIRIKQAFDHIKAYRGELEEIKKYFTGDWAINKITGKIFKTFYGGVFFTVPVIAIGVAISAGTALLPFIAGGFGSGMTASLIHDKIGKAKLDQKLLEVLRKFTDLSKLAHDHELLATLQEAKEAEEGRAAVMQKYLGISEA